MNHDRKFPPRSVRQFLVTFGILFGSYLIGIVFLAYLMKEMPW